MLKANEVFASAQNPASWRSPYTFTGKEFDAESGLHYFGARYYLSSLGVWLSTDPLADQFANMSPYAYAANNPALFTDRWGLAPDPPAWWKALGTAINTELKSAMDIKEDVVGFSSFFVEIADSKVEKIQPSNRKTKTKTEYVVSRAVKYLNENAIKDPNYWGGKCSPFVPNAINAGFGEKRIPTNQAGGAYGPYLEQVGFTEIEVNSIQNYAPQMGDIAVIEGYPGGTMCRMGPCGHIQMYNGRQWVSDFIQPRPFWPGAKYERFKPQFSVYRWD